MNPRSTLVIGLVAATSAIAGFWLGRSNERPPKDAKLTESSDRQIKFYQSPMHPWIVSETSGRCTICGMELVSVYEGESGISTDDTVQLGPSIASVIGVNTITTEIKALERSLSVNGVFEVDHTRHRVLSARVPGRIEELHVDQVGIKVKAGEPLVTLYSPEMLTAQRVFLEHLIAGPAAVSSSQLEAAREHLLDLGATTGDIAQLESTRETRPTVTVRAPFDGTVIHRGERAFTGAYVEESDTLFQVGDLTEMWFMFDAYESDLGLLEPGQSIALYPPDSATEIEHAQISFIDPNLDPVKRTARVRVVIPNPTGLWHHQQTARAEVTIPLGEQLIVPRSAVLFTRSAPLVFEQVANATFVPRTVSLGVAGDDAYAVKSGLTEGAKVVTQAALLIEGQAQLNYPALQSASGMSISSQTDTDIAALRPLVLAAADASAALAADDLTLYIELIPRIREEWQNYIRHAHDAAAGPLNDLVMALTDGPTLEGARAPFEPFSTTVTDLAHQAGMHKSGVVNIFQCPMTPVLGTGRWVQRENNLRNPFFGARMLTCGAPVK